MLALLAAVAVAHAPPPRPTVLMTPQGYIAMGYPPCGTEEAKKAPMCVGWAPVPCPGADDNTRNTWTLPILPLGCAPQPVPIKGAKPKPD